MSPADEARDRSSDPPPVDPEVREALDDREEQSGAPTAEDAATRDEDWGEADAGGAPSG